MEALAPLIVLIITANLGRGVTEGEFLANIKAILEETGDRAIILWQEIDEDDSPNEHAGIRRLLTGRFRFAGWGTRVPIAFGKQWAKVREHVVRAAPGLKVGRIGLSPARFITETVLRYPGRPGLPPLVVLNVHFPRNDRRLWTRWRSVERKLKKRIRHWHRVGYTVIWGGDANRVNLQQMHPAEQVLAHDDLDHIRVIVHPRGVQVRLVEDDSIDLTIDCHDAQTARVELTPPNEKAAA